MTTIPHLKILKSCFLTFLLLFLVFFLYVKLFSFEGVDFARTEVSQIQKSMFTMS